MNNKIFIGSIIAVAILIGVSFTSVVGFQSVKSNSVKASPLFAVRTKRAIDEESKDLTCDYVGKGKASNTPLPTRDNKIALLQKTIDRISKMDDITFNRFMKIIIHHIHQDDIPRDVETQGIVNALNQIRGNPRAVQHYVDDVEAESITSGEICTYNGAWLPGCYIYLVLWGIYLLGCIIFFATLLIITNALDCMVSYIVC